MSELETNAARFRDYEPGFDYEYGGEVSRRPDRKRPEFKPKAVWLKSLWNKHVDRQFIQSLDKVHWLHRFHELSNDFQSKSQTNHPMQPVLWEIERFFDTAPSGAELSATGVLPNNDLTSTWGKIGILIDGRVTFAGNHMDIVWSGDAPPASWKNYRQTPREKNGKKAWKIYFNGRHQTVQILHTRSRVIR